MNKPLLIYDGDCGFCKRWIERWRCVTGERIDYEPYQAVQENFLEISEASFKKSVQLVMPGEPRKIFSGAEAVFRSLAFNPSKKWLLWLYEKIPVFKKGSEFLYQLVAQNRTFFSRLTRLGWGEDVKPDTYQSSVFIFFRFLALIYAGAFFSFSTQALGLIGSDGIIPAKLLVEHVKTRLGAGGFWVLPTWAWWNTSDFFIQFLCYGGIVLSGLLFAGILPGLVLVLLWSFYLSLVSLGQDFLSFQWDSLLLETGFLSVLLSPLTLHWKNSNFEPPSLIRFLLKWLLFRLMFLSGIAKLASGDAAWRTLTALNYYYQTQPLPPWTAWYVHHFPQIFHQISAVLMFGIELIVPFFIFFPRRIRHTAIFTIIGFQVLIMMTGNYGFFNLLTICLCVLVLDDTFWKRESLQAAAPYKIFPLGIQGMIAAVILFVSLSQMSAMGASRSGRSQEINPLVKILRPFRSINGYGLFGIMTTLRHEIIIEGSLDGQNWKAYEFNHKPGDTSRRPSFVAPLQPRLDWQMWFAALSNYQQNPWFLNLCAKLLGGSSAVEKLFAINPFPSVAPKYIRASFYEYQFSTAAQKKAYRVWWKREAKGFYLRPISLKEGNLQS